MVVSEKRRASGVNSAGSLLKSIYKSENQIIASRKWLSSS